MSASFETFIDIMENVFLITGWIFLLVGLLGIIMVVISYPRNLFNDEVLSFISMFIYSCMTIFGVILAKFHDRILIRPKQLQP